MDHSWNGKIDVNVNVLEHIWASLMAYNILFMISLRYMIYGTITYNQPIFYDLIRLVVFIF